MPTDAELIAAVKAGDAGRVAELVAAEPDLSALATISTASPR